MQEEQIVKLLLSLRIPPGFRGFRACVYAIELILKNPSALDQVTKVIYPHVAKRLGCTYYSAESSIRHAIEAMVKNREQGRIAEILGLPPDEKKGKYTNMEFLALCAMKLKEADT